MPSAQIRTALFVPATRPDRFAKALGAGADAVIIDLEDAVEAVNKVSARDSVLEFASAHPDVAFFLRVNDAATPWFDDDLAACRRISALAGILLPKAESAHDVQRVAECGKPVLPIVESARGVTALAELAAAEGVDRLSFGSLDLMLDLNTRPDTAGADLLLNHIRCQILLHSASQGLHAPLDGVHPDFADEAGLGRIAQQVSDMGFGGMLCIHPRQIPVIHAAFAPSADEVAWARRVLAMADSSGSSAFQMDGKMVDAPVIERARHVVAGAA
jgi:(S)-citramalyl-CoA lyase